MAPVGEQVPQHQGSVVLGVARGVHEGDGAAAGFAGKLVEERLLVWRR